MTKGIAPISISNEGEVTVLKVSMQEIKTAQTSIKNSKNKIQGQLNSSKSAWKNVSSSSGLSGAVKKAINAEIDNYQIPLLTKYYDTLHYLSGEFDKTIEDFQSTVRETSNSAIIDTDALSNAESKFSDQQTKYEEINAKFEQIYSSISSIVAVSTPSSSGFAKEMANTKKVLTNTKEWMDTFNGRKQNKNIANALSQQKTQLGRLQGVSGLSYSNPKALEVYQDKAFRNDVKNEHGKILNFEKHQKEMIIRSAMNQHPVLSAIEGKVSTKDINKISEYLNSIKEFKIDNLQSIFAGFLSGTVGLSKEVLSSKITDEVSENLAKKIVDTIKYNTVTFMDKGLVAATTTGSNVTFSAPPTLLTNVIRNGAKYAVPIVGSVIDFGIQKSQGENTGDALIKTGGHVGAGMMGAAIGSAIPIPGLGTAVGFVVGVAGSMAFDLVYDNKEKIIKTASKNLKSVGDAFKSFTKGLGTVFG